MKKLILSLSIIGILYACNDTNSSKKNSTTTEKAEENSTLTSKKEERKVENTREAVESVSEKVSVRLTENQLQSTITNFQNCKATSEKRSDCRNLISKFISNVYQISDFRDNANDYVIYDSIQPIIRKSRLWRDLGPATNQSTIDEAMSHVNNNGLALVIDTSQSYGHVVVLQKGALKKSGSWGLELPIVVSLSNYKPEKSFYDKSMAYAFQKSDDLHVFIRE